MDYYLVQRIEKKTSLWFAEDKDWEPLLNCTCFECDLRKPSNVIIYERSLTELDFKDVSYSVEELVSPFSIFLLSASRERKSLHSFTGCHGRPLESARIRSGSRSNPNGLPISENMCCSASKTNPSWLFFQIFFSKTEKCIFFFIFPRGAKNCYFVSFASFSYIKNKMVQELMQRFNDVTKWDDALLLTNFVDFYIRPILSWCIASYIFKFFTV